MLIGTFVLLPFNIKGFLVILFLVFSFYNIYNNNRANPINSILINATLYITYLFSLLYTENFKAGFGLLETTLSLLVLPIGFLFISTNEVISTQIISGKKTFLKSFFYSCTILSLLILVCAVSYFDSNDSKILINPFLTFLDTNFFWMSDHPIYLSLAIALSMLMLPDLIRNKQKTYKIIILVCFLFQLVAVIIMSRKGILISFIFVFCTRVILESRFSIKSILYTISFIGIIGIVIVQISADTLKRFREVVDPKSYERVEDFSSTSIRYYIYDCSLSVSKKSLLFGYGIGDVKAELKDCYKQLSTTLYIGNYNSHNQYLGVLLYSGLFGLIIFLFSLGFNFRLFFLQNDYFSLSIILLFMLTMFFENILDRQNGVILYSFFINYLAFINISKNNEKSITNRTNT